MFFRKLSKKFFDHHAHCHNPEKVRDVHSIKIQIFWEFMPVDLHEFPVRIQEKVSARKKLQSEIDLLSFSFIS